MATDFYFYCYPWDLEDEGLDVALTRLKGDLLVGGINVAAAYPDIAAFRPRRDYKHRTLRLSAGVAFQPDAPLYASTHLRPITGNWIKSRNPLAKIVESVKWHEIKLRLTVECCANAPLAHKNPMAVGVNAFAEPMPDRLCPSNPDVQAYLMALVEDLCVHYSPESIELRSADFGPGLRENEDAAPLSEPARYCLSLCFCASCRRAATESGVDSDEAAECARTVIDDWDAARQDWTIGDLLNENETLAGYQRSRTRTIADLYADIKRKAQTVNLVAPIRDAPFHAQSANALSKILEGYVCTHQVAAASGTAATGNAEAAFTPERKHVRVHASRRLFRDGPHLVAEVRRIIERKVASIGFQNYGLLPEPCLDWVRQAVRYAKREAGG